MLQLGDQEPLTDHDMTRRRFAIGAGLLLLAAAGLWRTRRPPESPKVQIRRLLARAEQGAERRSASTCMACVSRDYSDPEDNTYHTLRQLAVRGFYSVDAVDVTVHVRELEVNGDRAKALIHVAIAARQADYPVSETESDMTVHLRRERQGWRHSWKVLRVEGWSFPDVEPY